MIPTREQKQVEIGGKIYTITKLPATKGLKYQKYFLKVLGPAYIEAQKSEHSTMADVLAKVIEHLDEIDEEKLKGLVVDSEVVSAARFDLEFSGNLLNLFKLIKEIVFFNYEDVFTLLGMGEAPA